MKNFSYSEPAKMGAALSFLAEHQGKAKILAGGTDLIPQMKRGLSSPEGVLNLSRIPGLKEIKENLKGIKIGAMVPLGVLSRLPLQLQSAGGLGRHDPSTLSGDWRLSPLAPTS